MHIHVYQVMIQTNVTPSLKRCLITYGAKRCSSHSHCCSSSSSSSRNSQGPKLFEYRRRLPAVAVAISKPHSRSQSHEYINRRFFSKDAVSGNAINKPEPTINTTNNDETTTTTTTTTTPSEMGISVPAEGKIKSISNEHISNNDLNLATQAANEDLGQDLSDSNLDSDPAFVPLNIENIPGTSKGGSRKLAIIFTCNVCETRSAKRFTEQAYNHGVVLVRCPKCESLHLIADRLGYFSDNNDNDNGDGNGNGGKGWDIETFMASIGQEDNVRVAAEGKEVLEVTLKDVLGDKMPMPTRSSTSSEDSTSSKK